MPKKLEAYFAKQHPRYSTAALRTAYLPQYVLPQMLGDIQFCFICEQRAEDFNREFMAVQSLQSQEAFTSSLACVQTTR